MLAKKKCDAGRRGSHTHVGLFDRLEKMISSFLELAFHRDGGIDDADGHDLPTC